MENYELFNSGLYETLIRFGLNISVAFVVLRLIYYPRSRSINYLFTFIVFNIVVFFITSLLSDVKMKTAVGFGLFAVFSILRYRTEQIPIKEMTFLFLSITIAVINGWNTTGFKEEDAVSRISVSEILAANFLITIITVILDRALLSKISQRTDGLSFNVSYPDIQKFKTFSNDDIIKEMKEVTGLDVKSVKVKKVDIQLDKVDLVLYYSE